MIHKNIAYRRRMRRKHINRRAEIVGYTFCILSITNALENPRKLGALAKGKVHCSCPSCSLKTKRTEYGEYINSIKTYKAQDRRSLDRLMYNDDYNDEEQVS